MQAVAIFKKAEDQGIEALVDVLSLRQKGRQIASGGRMYEHFRDARTIFDTDLKYVLRNELIHATGRYFPYPNNE